MSSYLVEVGIAAAVNGLVAAAVYLMFAAGRLSLCSGVFMFVGAVVSGTAVSHGYSVPLAIFGGMLAGAVTASMLYAFLLRLRGFEFALATIVVAEIVRFSVLANDSAGGALGFRNVDATVDVRVPIAVGALMLLCIVGWERSPSRRALEAIATDDALARSLGIRIDVHRLFAFAAAGALAAFAGFIYVHRVGIFEPRSIGADAAIETLAFTIAGGRRHVLGPVVVAIAGTIALEIFRFTIDARLIVYGALLVLLAILAPEGIIARRKPSRTQS
jgi:branched-chain amino acid transport system permease protein